MIAKSKEFIAREWAESVLRRAVWLEEADRRLLQQVLGQGRKARDIAAEYDVQPRAIQRRVVALAERLTDRQVIAVLRHHRDWPAPLGTIALATWVQHRNRRHVAEHLGLSYHQVRQAEQRIRGLLAAMEPHATDRSLWSADLIPVEVR